MKKIATLMLAASAAIAGSALAQKIGRAHV